MIIDESIYKYDPELASFMEKELDRQRHNIELIASENFISLPVMKAMGSHLTNKYAEGYPSKRYYGGCEYVDEIENLAIERLKKLYNAEHANVQPHSGSSANIAAYFSVLKPGDTVLGMDLTHGGHLTHGSPVNISGKYFNFASYGVNKESETLDYDEILRIAEEVKPKLIVAGASAYPRVIDFSKFREIADKVGAYLMVDMAHIAGLVAAGLHQNPVEYADIVTTTTHKTLRGPRGGAILCKKELSKKVDKAIFPGTQGGPLVHVIAAKAVCFKEAMRDEFREYQKQIVKNSKALADGLIKRGFRLVSGGTDNHLILVDLTNKNVTGKEAQNILDEIHVTANKNTIPFETKSPFVTSGLRLGTPAVTTRGMKENEMYKIANIIADAIENKKSKYKLIDEVTSLCNEFPLYNE